MGGCARAMAAASTVTASDTVYDWSLTIDFIFEVGHGGGETSVQGHVGVADEAEPKRERKRLGERLALEDAAADELAGNGGQHVVFTRRQDVDAADLDFLMQ